MPVGDDEFIMKFFEDSGPGYSPFRKILAQRFDSNCQPVWPNNTLVYDQGSINGWYQILPFINDGNDGFYIAWYDYRLSGTIASAWVQHVNANGQPQFQSNGVLLSTSDATHQFYPFIASPADDPNLYVFWREVNSLQTQWGLYGQKISPEGQRLWGDIGKVLIPVSSLSVSPQYTTSIESDILFVYTQSNGGSNEAIKATRLDSNGNSVWEGGSIDVSSTVSLKSRIEVSKFDGNQWVISWNDSRDGGFNIYAQNLLPDGSMGAQGTISGTVTIENNLALVTEVVIAVGFNTTYPNEQGYYSIDLPVGTYSVSASHPFTLTQVIENVVVNSGGEPSTVNFELTMLRRDMSCQAIDQYGNQIHNVEVTIQGPEDSYTGLTSSSPLVFENVPYGQYTGIALAGTTPPTMVQVETVINGFNGVITFIFDVEELEAAFEVDATSGYAPLTVQFTDLSSGGPESWAWDFGDGSSSDEQNPLHSYSIPGVYSITLIVSNFFGSDTLLVNEMIEVLEPLAAPSVETLPVIEIMQTSASSGGTVTSDGGDEVVARGVVWSLSENPTLDDNLGFTIDGSGLGNFTSIIVGLLPETTYYIKAYATNSIGTNFGQQEVFSTLPLAPVAAFSATVTQGYAPLTVQFTDESSHSPISWSWNFGDGNTSDAQNPTHTYLEVGSYTVSLAVSNSGGNHTETKVNYITVLQPLAIPTVVTHEVTNVTTNEAQSGGEVTSDGGAEVTVRGVVWSTFENPTIESNEGITNDGEGVGAFVSHLDGLNSFTIYFLRAYAVNSEGVGYGSQVSFTTLDTSIDINTLSDISVFPIPFTKQINISSRFAIERISILTVGGIKVFDNQINGLSKVQVDVENLQRGVYIISILLSDGQLVTKRIVK